MNTFVTILFGVSLAALPAAIMIFNERRLRRLAFAKLEIARATTQMEKLMLAGDLKLGGVCHDHIFRFMVHAETSQIYSVSRHFLKLPSEQEREAEKQLRRELTDDNPEIRNVLMRFVRAYFRAFGNSKPLAYVIFTVKRLVCTGALYTLVKTLLFIIVGLEKYQSFREKWKHFKADSAEMSVAHGISANA